MKYIIDNNGTLKNKCISNKRKQIQVSESLDYVLFSRQE